jgi:hypothetical protein
MWRACGTYGGEESNIHGFVAKTLKERDHLQDLGIDGRVLLKLIFKKIREEAWIGLIWLRTGISGGLL